MANPRRTLPEIRRIVTDHDEAGKARVWLDGPATNSKYPDGKVISTLIWSTEGAPADFMQREDAGARVIGTAPPDLGTRFAIIDFEPGNELHGQHRTDTVDYCICLAGTIDMLLDDETVTMQAGDVLIQRGTNHAWINRGTVPARVAFVLVDGRPKRANSVSGRSNAR